MPKRYTIITRHKLLRDEASVKRHIEADDYFGTAATILQLIKEQIIKNPDASMQELTPLLAELSKDLALLQSRCQIVYRDKNHNKPKIRNKNKTPKGRLISQ